MSIKSWKLTDSANNVFVEALAVMPLELGGMAKGFSVRKSTLRGGLRDGVDLIEIDNGRFQFSVLPTRGMGIWKAALGEIPVAWNSPVKGPVHPKFVPVAEPSGLGWLDGFDELLARCGILSNGAPDFDAKGTLTYPLHGRIANLPAHTVDLTIDEVTGELTLVGVVDEVRFHCHKLRLTSTIKTKLGESGLRITDEITNLSGNPGEAQLLYHINFGAPFCVPGSKLVVPAKAVAPRDADAVPTAKTWNVYGLEKPGSIEQVFYFELLSGSDGRTRTLLRDPRGDFGVSLVFDTKQLPCFTVWKNTPAARDGYVTGLEPATNYPNPRSFETQQKRVVALAPGQIARFDVALEVHGDLIAVQQAEAEIKKLQGGTSPTVFEQPREGWSPTAKR